MTNVNKIPIKHSIIFISTCAWGILGFKRGLNSYDHDYSCRDKLFQHSKKKTNPFYIDKLGWGLAGTLTYINPCTFFFVLYKEVYRLEVNLRGLEDEKKTDYYNTVL
jgi:hypothetical protein